MSDTNAFTGPLFIVGRPRSGTKLLRDLLNCHSQLSIPTNESQFIPYYYRIINNFGDLRSKDNFRLFYKDIMQSTFLKRLARKNKSISMDDWHNAIKDWSYAGVIEAFYRTYTEREGKAIWGDKTPEYLVHLSLLYDLFPKARVIHIIRDPRDYCLSINRAWGKNIYRAAQNWFDGIVKCRKDGVPHDGEGYCEIKYEELLDDATETLTKICKFINIEFEDAILKPGSFSENIGDAKGASKIVRNNYGKWKQSFSISQIRKIEKICSPVMIELGYQPAYQGGHHRLNSVELWIYKAFDGINTFQHKYSKEKNFLKTCKDIIYSRKVRSKRNIK